MDQLQHEVHVLMWANIGILGVFGFLVLCWVGEFLSKWFGPDNSERRQRRSQERQQVRQAEEKSKEQVTDISSQIQAAIAAEIAKHVEASK
jgi:hypothetical protein